MLTDSAGGGGRAKRPRSQNLPDTFYKCETWHSYTLPKEDPKKYMNHVTHSLSSADISIFSVQISKFCYIIKIQIKIAFWYIISNSFNFFWVFKDFLINMVTILMMSAKLATQGLLKIKLFWNKGYDVIILDSGVTNKILWHEPNYIVDVVMWSKFGNSSISLREEKLS